MERAVFGASDFFSKKAFTSSFRGIEYVQLRNFKESNIDFVEIWFNPWKVSYHELVELFFDLHDPTGREDQPCKNQSFIYFSDTTQLMVAKHKKNEQSHLFNDQIITELIPVREYLKNKV